MKLICMLNTNLKSIIITLIVKTELPVVINIIIQEENFAWTERFSTINIKCIKQNWNFFIIE